MGWKLPADLRILVVEDSEDLLAIWRVLFRKEGLMPRFCSTGTQALAIIDHELSPDLVMTDYYLPDITGLDLIREIGARSKSIACLLVTGNRDDAFVDMVNDAGVEVIFKPVRFPVLMEKLYALSCALPRTPAPDDLHLV